MIKTIVLAAAGRGARMQSVAKGRPKHLLPVHGKPFLFYLLRNIKKAGYENVILVIGYYKKFFLNFAKEYSHEFNLEVIDQFEKMGSKNYGTAVPVAAAMNNISGQSFVYLMADNLYGVNDLLAAREASENTVFGMPTNRADLYGDLSFSSDKELISFKEKSEPGQKVIGNSGLYTLLPSFLPFAKNVSPSKKTGEFTVTQAILDAKQEYPFKVAICTDPWLDFGKPEDIEKMEEYLGKLWGPYFAMNAR